MARYTFDEQFKQHFIQVCNASTSMSQAAMELGMNYKTLCSHAKRLNCFKSNQSGKGISKALSKQKIPLSDIFSGVHKTFQSHKLKKRLIKEGIKKAVCSSCKLEQWLGMPIPLELHHIDGNRYNNQLENLALLCPNCHAMTSSYRAKNIRNLSAQLEMADVKPLKIGETSKSGNPEPSPNLTVGEGVET